VAGEGEREQGWGYAEGEESVESPETLSPDERGEDPAEEGGFEEPKEP
jgi:hypothetical protein